MSELHPIIAITGSSGAGTTSVTRTFCNMFRREHVNAAIIEGDSFHRYDRKAMREAVAKADKEAHSHFSHFGHEANLFEDLEKLFADYAATGRGKRRKYLHDAAEAEPYKQDPGTFTAWEDVPPSDLLYYEGLHGAVVHDKTDVAQHPDLLIGVVPVINLEWIQKIHRDHAVRGYSKQEVMDMMLRRMHDYVHYICPQFTETDINFQRVPTVDTSNPFAARWIPTADESMVIIRFARPRGIDFPYLLSMIHDSFMSRANSIVIPGAKLDLAMQLILTPFVLKLVETRRRLV